MKINAVYKILDKPIIMASTGGKYWHKLNNASKEKAYLLIHPMWHFGLTSAYRYHRHRIALKKKNIQLIILNNSKREHIFAKISGFTSYFLNQNLHSAENKFQIKESKKIYDAVYIAAAHKYKRIHLARLIKDLYIITYFWPDVRNKNGKWDLHKVEPRVKHAKFNGDFIDREEVCNIINQSKCGLALSKKEGAMWAVMEYFLSGIPVVSTKSLGGRDIWLDNNYTCMVKSNPKAVAKGVERIIQSDIDPFFIRQATLKKMNHYRKKYYVLVKYLVNNHGYEIPEYEEFHEKVWGGEGIEKLRII